MAKQDHRGKRRPRHERIERRNLELGYYLIYTDTEGTERAYFEGLHKSLPDEVRSKLQIKVVDGIKTRELISKACRDSSYDPQLRETWIIFDRDQVTTFDKIIEKAESLNIHVGWSNPCIEIWLHAYLGRLKTFDTSVCCCESLKRICRQKMNGYEYNKTDSDLYQRFYTVGSEEGAIKTAKNRYISLVRDGITVPSEMNPCTTAYKLVEEIRSKL